MDNRVRKIVDLITKHQIQSDSYDCEGLEAEIAKILESGDEEIKGHLVSAVVTESGFRLMTVADNGHLKYFVEGKEVASYTYEPVTSLSSERLEILFLNK